MKILMVLDNDDYDSDGQVVVVDFTWQTESDPAHGMPKQYNIYVDRVDGKAFSQGMKFTDQEHEEVVRFILENQDYGE